MSDLEKYSLDSGKTFKIAPSYNHILTQNSLEVITDIARTAISMMV